MYLHKCTYSIYEHSLRERILVQKDESSFLVLTETLNGMREEERKRNFATGYSLISSPVTSGENLSTLLRHVSLNLYVKDLWRNDITILLENFFSKLLTGSSSSCSPCQWESISSLQALGQTSLSHSSP